MVGEHRNLFLLFWRSFKRKPEGGRCEGVMYYLGGKIVETFCWGLGTKTNNEAKWLAIMYRIEPMAKRIINKTIIQGDSRQVIQKMRRGYRNGNIRCRIIAWRISHHTAGLDLRFVHILRKNNVKVDSLANKGAKLDIGCILFQFDDLKHHPLP